jgi:hypothetical protein
LPFPAQSDPYGNDSVDFPLVAYEHFMREEGIEMLEGTMERIEAREAERKRLDENGQTTTDHVMRPGLCPNIVALTKELGQPWHAETIINARFNFEALQNLPYRGKWSPPGSVVVTGPRSRNMPSYCGAVVPSTQAEPRPRLTAIDGAITQCLPCKHMSANLVFRACPPRAVLKDGGIPAMLAYKIKVLLAKREGRELDMDAPELR